MLGDDLLSHGKPHTILANLLYFFKLKDQAT